VLAADWQPIVAMLGMTVRKVRTLLGWSQQELANRAVVSQGLISRLERGVCAAVPFHSVVVVSRTLAAGASALNLPLSPTAAQVLAFAPSLNGDFTVIGPDADFAYIAHTLQRMPRERRAAFLTIIRAAAAALGDDDA
jgi:transcriptional regulator with XRE-family HTH domain